MKPIPFDPATDVAPIPFDRVHLSTALEMKHRGLKWHPHVGCFVWDHDNHIDADSPFPLRVYFILSLPRFISIFGSPAAICEKVVWLPTWHQARLLADRLGVNQGRIAGLWQSPAMLKPGEELLEMYRLIRNAL